MRRSGAAPLPSIVVLVACESAAGPTGPPTTTGGATGKPRPRRLRPTRRRAEAEPGTERSSVEDDTVQFTAGVRLTADDVLIFEVTGAAGSLAIRDGSPPTREPPEPSRAVFLIDGAASHEVPPAAMQRARYEPDAGVAGASVARGGRGRPRRAGDRVLTGEWRHRLGVLRLDLCRPTSPIPETAPLNRCSPSRTVPNMASIGDV